MSSGLTSESIELSDDEIDALHVLECVDRASAESVPHKTLQLIPSRIEQRGVCPALQAVSDSLESGAATFRLSSGDEPDDYTRRSVRRLGVAQIGSAGVLDEERFAANLSRMVISSVLPAALHVAAECAGREHEEHLRRAAALCETDPCAENARLASDVADRAWTAGRDKEARLSALAAGIAGSRAAAAAGLTRIAFPVEWRAGKAASALIEVVQSIQHGIASMLVDEEHRSESNSAAVKPGFPYASRGTFTRFVNGVVEILGDMGAPGCRLLWMADDGVARNMQPRAIRRGYENLHGLMGHLLEVAPKHLPVNAPCVVSAREEFGFIDPARAEETDLIRVVGTLSGLATAIERSNSVAGYGETRELLTASFNQLEAEAPAATMVRWIIERRGHEPVGEFVAEMQRRSALYGHNGTKWREWATPESISLSDEEEVGRSR